MGVYLRKHSLSVTGLTLLYYGVNAPACLFRRVEGLIWVRDRADRCACLCFVVLFWRGWWCQRGACLFVSVCEGLFVAVTGVTLVCPGGAPLPQGLVWLNAPGGISADRCT